MLDDLRKKYRPESDQDKVPLPPLPLGVRVVISFDQSLGNTGVVTYDGTSVAAWTLRAPKDTGTLTGHAKTLSRSVALQDEVLDVLRRVEIDTDAPGAESIAVVYETPSMAKGKMTRTESSLLGAHCIEWAYHHLVTHGYQGMFRLIRISAQRTKGVVTGNPRADKAEIKEALIRTYMPEQVGACTNEHERDALANMVTYLKDHA